MKRSIVVAQALALVSACRSEPASTNTTNTNNTTNTQGSGGDRTVVSSGGGESAEEIRARQAAALNRVLTVEQCSSQNADGFRCEQASSRCGGSASHCASSGDPRVPDRCSGSEWNCQCSNETGELRWQCRQMMHAAGPLAPPELDA
ncbi:MAG: hypothetical protein JNK05_07060 [Myxococcales bacterium]|nr:hypothetical protein [Myxococcales bacterium]